MSNKMEATFHGLTPERFREITGYDPRDCEDHEGFRQRFVMGVPDE